MADEPGIEARWKERPAPRVDRERSARQPDNLAPCPFCGCKRGDVTPGGGVDCAPVLVRIWTLWKHKPTDLEWGIECYAYGCGARTANMPTEDQAVRRWNMRKPT